MTAQKVKARLLSIATVQRMTGLSRTTLWRMQRRGEFPKPVKVSERRVAHRAADVESWLNGLPEAR